MTVMQRSSGWLSCSNLPECRLIAWFCRGVVVPSAATQCLVHNSLVHNNGAAKRRGRNSGKKTSDELPAKSTIEHCEEWRVPSIDIEQVTREYFPRIHRAALVMCGNPWDADDLAQETFLILAQQRNRFRGQGRLFTYLYGILLNLDRRERRRHGTRRRALRILHDETPVDNRVAPAAETAVEVSEWKHSLWSRVAQLPDAQRETLILRFSEQLRYEEIAAVLECPLGTVKSRIFNGLQTLRHVLLSESQDVRTTPAHPGEDLVRAI